MLKKIAVGAGVIGVFVVYSLWVRHEQPTVVKPSQLAAASTGSNSSSSPTSGSSGSGGMMSQQPGGGNTGMMSQYRDGTYTGSVADAYYGNVQVQTVISGGKISDVSFLQYPDTHSDSVMINQQAMPYLKQETIQAQSANVQIISGATFTSQAFIQSLGAALSQAKA